MATDRRPIDFAYADDARIGVDLDDQRVLAAVATLIDDGETQMDGFDVGDFHAEIVCPAQLQSHGDGVVSRTLRVKLAKIGEFPLPFSRLGLRIFLTTWFRYLIESGGGMGPLKPQQPVAHPAMLVLTPPGLAGRDKIVRCTSLLLYSLI